MRVSKTVEDGSFDLQNTPEFKSFMKSVEEYIHTEGRVSWRMLAIAFPDSHYWLTLAIEKLDGKSVKWKRHLIPEIIIPLSLPN